MTRREPIALLACLIGHALLATGCGDGERPAGVLRVGHFPNLTHAQALIARGASEGRQVFENALGPGLRIEWFVYAAGPAAMEALLANAIDLTYVGPSPAINAHLRSKGDEVRVLAGAARGGSALVVAGSGKVRSAADLRGKTIATPQLGNTQDVAARAWLSRAGLRATLTGGDVTIQPAENADMPGLLQSGSIEGAWTVEPWVSRLELDAGGRVLVEDKESPTTVLTASARFLRERPELAKRFVEAHGAVTSWTAGAGAKAKEAVRRELASLTKREIPADLIDRAWNRLRFEIGIARADFDGFLSDARAAGLAPGPGDLARLVETPR